MMRQLNPGGIIALSAGTPEDNAANIRKAIARGLPEFTPAHCAHDGNMVIVGSGPSLPDFVEEIRAEKEKGRPICAAKGAHDLLVEKGVIPDLFVTCEPRFREIRHPQADNCTYLISSRCHPDLFDLLKKAGSHVVVWHSWASKPGSLPPEGPGPHHWRDFNPLEECEVWRGRFGVGGGSTSGLRALAIAHCMGFRNAILYGFDSCLAKDRNTKRFTGEKVGDALILDVIVDGERFFCNGALADQAAQFQRLLQALPGMKVEVKGPGLLAAIMKARARRK